MKNATDYTKNLGELIKKIKKKHNVDLMPVADPIAQMIFAFLEWNASTEQANEAMARLMDVMVDFNDVRVSLPHEIEEIIGKYPQLAERVDRMRESLQEIYMREHATNLKSLQGKGKKEVRNYLVTLPGMTPYVASQVALRCFDVHCVPVDDETALQLKMQGVVDPAATLSEIDAFLSKQIVAGEGEQLHAELRAWMDSGAKRVTIATPKQSEEIKKAVAKIDSETRKLVDQEANRPKPSPAEIEAIKAAKPKRRNKKKAAVTQDQAQVETKKKSTKKSARATEEKVAKTTKKATKKAAKKAAKKTAKTSKKVAKKAAKKAAKSSASKTTKKSTKKSTKKK